MFTHVFHVPQVLRKKTKTKTKKETALVLKIMGRLEDFFFLEIEKKKKSAGFSRARWVTANKQFFMPYHRTTTQMINIIVSISLKLDL